ncbi:MAG TPA: hypothetical protein VFE38_10960 [Edaphobacter sp.]|nr:hypothetical protein [Edaphobacter sp.]
MGSVTRRSVFTIAVAAIVIACLCWFGWRARRKPPVSTTSSNTTAVTEIAPSGDLSPTTVYAHNLRLRKGPNFRVYVRWIRGLMVRTHPQVVPSFDDPNSFVLEIQKGVIRANIGDIANYLNSVSSKAPLKNISIEPAGAQLKLHGTVHKIIPLPVELTGTLSPLPDGRVQFQVAKINVLKVPLKGLLGGFHVQLDDLIHASNVPGVQVSGNNVVFDTQGLLPPPHIRGQITSISIKPPDIELIYGNSPDDEARLAQWHNFIRFRGGSVGFGKLTMNYADITMIDASKDPWFDLDLANYQAQLVNGYTRMTPQAGLEIFMPDLDEQASKKKTAQAVTLEWLKDRNRALPPDVPVK